MTEKNVVALGAGVVAYVAHLPQAYLAVAVLLALSLVVDVVSALRRHQPLASAVDPWVNQAVYYVALMVLAGVAGPYVPGLPALSVVTGLIVVSVASRVLHSVEGLGVLPLPGLGSAPAVAGEGRGDPEAPPPK